MTLVIVSFIMTLSFNYMNCQHEYYRTIYPVIYPTLRYSQIGVDLMMFLLLLIQSYKKDIALTVFSVLGIVLYGIRAMFYLDLVRLEETPYLIWDILITGLPLFWSIMFFREIKRNQATDILDN
ncbi:MAG: hypothetical protein MK078_15210 [Crocinitomicaceae bacterium]|nr:hypothetical protein [Crocinitomicaceae bacterium]